jgi:hypothetical protein
LLGVAIFSSPMLDAATFISRADRFLAWALMPYTVAIMWEGVALLHAREVAKSSYFLFSCWHATCGLYRGKEMENSTKFRGGTSKFDHEGAV